MTKILLGVLTAILFIGCSSDAVEQNVEPKLVVGQSIADLKLNDQFEKSHTLSSGTNKIVFAFSKDGAHICNDYFNTKEPTYLASHNTQFVADVSAAPSLIRSMFIMPGLKDFKHTVLLLDDKAIAAPYRKDMNVEKIVIIFVDNGTVTAIKTVNNEAELISEIESK